MTISIYMNTGMLIRLVAAAGFSYTEEINVLNSYQIID